MANFLILTRFSAVLWHIPNNNILFKEASCEEKRPWCCRRPIKTWQNRHLSTYSSLRSLKSSVKACILLSLSYLLLRGLQTVKLIEELDLRQKKNLTFSPWAGRRSGPPRMRAWSIVSSSLPSQLAALPKKSPF